MTILQMKHLTDEITGFTGRAQQLKICTQAFGNKCNVMQRLKFSPHKIVEFTSKGFQFLRK